LLILAPSAVLCKLRERLLVQPALAKEVWRSAHARDMRDYSVVTAFQYLIIILFKAEVFMACVGGLYREQGMDVVTRWLRSVIQVGIRDAYESVRREHLLPEERPEILTLMISTG